MERARLEAVKASASTQENNATFLRDALMKRAAAVQALTLAFSLHDITSEKGSEYQREVISNLLEQPIL